jgi:hypothetical protein
MDNFKEPQMQRISVEGGATLFQMQNKKGTLLSTDYFDCKLGKAGLYYISFNAYAGRLLIPDTQAAELFVELEKNPVAHVVLSMGKTFDKENKCFKDMGELMFEDGTDAPFSVIIQSDLIDRRISSEPMETTLALHTRDGAYDTTFKLYVRTVGELPYLRPWKAS